jgi:hypothetical protein
VGKLLTLYYRFRVGHQALLVRSQTVDGTCYFLAKYFGMGTEPIAGREAATPDRQVHTALEYLTTSEGAS